MLKYTILTGRYILKFENMALQVWLIFVQFSNAPMYWLLLANKNTKKWSAYYIHIGYSGWYKTGR